MPRGSNFSFTSRLLAHDPSFLNENARPHNNRALILLNQPILARTAFKRSFAACEWRVVADGAADRLLAFIEQEVGPLEGEGLTAKIPRQYVPDLIIGDLDSISIRALTIFLALGTLIAHEPDQDSTDFGKAIDGVMKLRLLRGGRRALRAYTKTLSPSKLRDVFDWTDLAVRLEVRAALQSSAEPYTTGASDDVNNPNDDVDIVVFSSLAGRVDQGLGVLSEMARYRLGATKDDPLKSTRPDTYWDFWLVTDRSLTLVLDGPPPCEPPLEPPYPNRDHGLQVVTEHFTANCGLIPIFGEASLTTRGLEWDVDNWHTSMGGDISTSNHVTRRRHDVVVTTDMDVLFTIELADHMIA